MVAPDNLIIADSEALGRKVLSERVRNLYELSPYADAAAFACIAVAVYGLDGAVPGTLLIGWAIVQALVACAVAGMYLHYRGVRPTEAELPRRERGFAAVAGAAGCGWGLFAIALMPQQSLPHQMLVVFIVLSMILVGLGSMQASRLAFAWFALPAVAGLVLRLLMRGGMLDLEIAALACVVSLLVFKVFLQMHREMVQMLTARFEKDAALEDMKHVVPAAVDARQARSPGADRFEAAMNASPAGMWDWDLTADQLTFSPRFRELLGYADEAEFNREFSFGAHLHPDDLGRVQEVIQQQIDGKGIFDEMFRLRCKNGLYRWFLGRGQAQWNEAGKAVRFAGAIIDVTQLKVREEALRRAETLLKGALAQEQAILDTAIVGIAIFKDRVIWRCNRRFALMFGYAEDELVLGITEHQRETAVATPDDAVLEDRDPDDGRVEDRLLLRKGALEQRFGPPQRLLAHLELRDIDDRARESDRLARLVPLRLAAPQEPAVEPVLAAQAEHLVEDSLAVDLLLDDLLHPAEIVRMQVRPEAEFPVEFGFVRIAEQFAKAGREGELVRRQVPVPHPRRGSIHRRFEAIRARRPRLSRIDRGGHDVLHVFERGVLFEARRQHLHHLAVHLEEDLEHQQRYDTGQRSDLQVEHSAAHQQPKHQPGDRGQREPSEGESARLHRTQAHEDHGEHDEHDEHLVRKALLRHQGDREQPPAAAGGPRDRCEAPLPARQFGLRRAHAAVVQIHAGHRARDKRLDDRPADQQRARDCAVQSIDGDRDAGERRGVGVGREFVQVTDTLGQNLASEGLGVCDDEVVRRDHDASGIGVPGGEAGVRILRRRRARRSPCARLPCRGPWPCPVCPRVPRAAGLRARRTGSPVRETASASESSGC